MTGVFYTFFNFFTPIRRLLPRNKLQKYKNIHNGERCFIVATGPSLIMDDLELIKDEYIISVNSIILSKDKTNFRPTYYLLQDPFVYKKLKNAILENPDYFVNPPIFGDIVRWRCFFDKKPKDVIYYGLNCLNHVSFEERDWKYGFSKDFAKEVIDGFSVTYSAIQLAYYMGFTKVYLLGQDCNYSKEVNHFISYGLEKNNCSDGALRMIKALDYLKNYLTQDDNFEIYNATRGGMLEVFERVNLEDVVSGKNL